MPDETLKSQKLKTTKRREAILEILRASTKPMTTEEIYMQVLREVHMSISTAYRTLATLSDKQILIKELGQDGKTYFRINDHRHRHFLRCVCCGETILLDGCPIEKLEKDWAEKTGYQITGHSLEVSGICPKCAAKGGKKSHAK